VSSSLESPSAASPTFGCEPARPAPACDARASLVVLLRCRSPVASVDPHSGWRAVLFDESQVLRQIASARMGFYCELFC
jgi:hypothetical protein